ncbi:MAG: hypothetical protein M9953_05435 [Thermomicrobiales bacterium]|nr:hypothetical protein [Thermomicrobiales bacterium]MCO5224760.1 hypothetical protein [Thermomicrobiales bacterium]
MPATLAAQTLRGTEFTSDLGGPTVRWTEDWEASLEGDDDFSTMLMLQGEIMIFAVMFVYEPLPEMSMRSVYFSLSDVLVANFDSQPTQVYEWQAEDGSFRGLNVIQLSGINFVLYMRVDPGVAGVGPTMQFAGAPVRAFPSSLTAMQTEITIDGLPAMADDDGEELLALLESNEASAADPSLADAAGTHQRVPVGTTAKIPTPDIFGGEFVSETNDFTVRYGEEWSPTDSMIGEFSLVSTGRPTTVVSFIGRSTTETNRAAYFEDIVARESRHAGFIGSVTDDDRLLIASWSNDDELSVLEYVFVDDDTVVTVMVTLSGSNPERGIDRVQQIELDGIPILQGWDELE